MAIPDARWHSVSASQHAHEQRALDWLRGRLPDHEPWRAWANFEFLAHDGSHNEVDVLVVGKPGVYLIEIKSHPGVVTGDQRVLEIRDPANRNRGRQIEHPIHLASLKAKRLRSLLERTKAFGGSRTRVPFIQSVIFMAEATRIDVPGAAAGRLFMKDVASQLSAYAEGIPGAEDLAEADPRHYPGIAAALTTGHGPGLRGPARVPIDKPTAKILTRALDETGIAQSPQRRARTVGDWTLGEKIDEGPTWQDYRGTQTMLPDVGGRIRRYIVDESAAVDLREQGVHRAALENAARREYTVLDRLDHPGVVRAKQFLSDEVTPYVVFEDTKGFLRLDAYLAEHGEILTDEDRLFIVGQVADALRHAHGFRIVHRGLGPQSVLVEPDGDGRPKRVKVHNWQVAARSATTVVPTYAQATQHADRYVEPASLLYAAPELHRNPQAEDPSLDVFSLGALTWLLFTGRPPAENRADLSERLSGGGLDLATDGEIDAVPALQTLVARATTPSLEDRYSGMEAFIEALADARGQLARRDDLALIPADAQAGQVLVNGLRVVERLGAGSTAVGLLVEDPKEDGRRAVLKVAIDPDHAERLAREAGAIRSLDHPNLPQFAGDLGIEGHAGFLMHPPATTTLRRRLQDEGPLHLEFLERYGTQLLEAVASLESKGVIHRDIKPDNIAVTDEGRNQAYKAVLFDFSLAGTPTDDLEAGTPAYADPFLTERPSKRWDLAAERFSAAMTLHEMATGTLPTWGGGAAPELTPPETEVAVARGLMDPGVAEPLAAFLETALARDAAKRFPSAEAMLEAWREIFRRTEHGEIEHAVGEDELQAMLEERLAAQGPGTPLAELPWSTRAQTALRRMNAYVVRDLLETPPNWLIAIRGVGRKTQGELDRVARALRARFKDVEIDADRARARMAEGPDGVPEEVAAPRAEAATTTATRTADDGKAAEPTQPFGLGPASDPGTIPPDVTLDEILARLLEGGQTPKTRFTAAERAVAEHLLGTVEADGDPEAARLAEHGHLPPLPTVKEIAERQGVSRQRVYQVLRTLRVRWARHPVATAMADELADHLDRNAGILELDESADLLLGFRGTGLPESELLAARRIARAVVRAATEAEADRGSANGAPAGDPRWQLRRRETRLYLAADDALVAWATRLGDAARALAEAIPLPPADEVRAAIERIAAPAGAGAAADAARTLRLAAAAAGETANLGPGGILYPAGLDPREAIVRTASALAGLGGEDDDGQPGSRLVDPAEVERRVRRAFPHAAPLPPRKVLAVILREIGWKDCTWDEERGRLRIRTAESVTVAVGSTVPRRYETLGGGSAAQAAGDPDVAEAIAFEERLRGVLEQRGFLVLRVLPREFDRAWDELLRRLGEFMDGEHALQAVDLDARLIATLDQVLAEAAGPSLATFEEAEAAGPAGPHWGRVRRVTERVVDRVREELAAARGPLLVRNVGLLARWQRMDLLQELNPMASAGEQLGAGCLLLLPRDGEEPSITVDGTPVDAIGEGQRAEVPRAWIVNRHRAATG